LRNTAISVRPVVVLDSFMREPSEDKMGTWGMMVGFGAGLYQATLLYRWV